MKLHTLSKSKGFNPKAKRRGRGNATGSGNYSGRGLKGQKARSGHTMRASFEGGQTSIVQRLPKARGFKRYFKLVKEYQIVNLDKLDQDVRVADTMEINKAVLKQLGYLKNEKTLVKILGNGTYAKHLTFVGIDKFSKTAQDMIDNPGKKVVEKKVEVKKVVEKKIATPKVVEKKVEVKKPVEKKVEVKPVEKKVEAPKVVEKKAVVKKVVEKKAEVKPAAKKTVAKPAPKAAAKPVAKKPVAKPAVKKTK